MHINRNMSAVITNNQLLRTENKLAASMERLSSGLKINHASDNPAGLAISKAGVVGKDIDGAARKVIEEASYGPQFSHSYGHGVGLEIHEAPGLSFKSEANVPENAVCSAEPGIYLAGKFGVRIEDCIIFKADGYENLATSPKELIIV